ncbi:MAG: Tol-Pal system beta propeller repeat protein TolB [bacterium]
MDIQTKTLILFAFILFSYFSLIAQLKGEITQENIEDFPVAVQTINAESKDLSDLTKDLSKVLKRDLQLSDFFNVLDSRSFLEKPEETAKKIDFKKWLQVGANGLVSGSLKKGEKGQMELSLSYHDVPDNKEKLQKKYGVNKKTARKAAHRFVYELVYFLAGEKLKFLSSKITFIEKSSEKYHLTVIDFDGANRKVLFSSSEIIILPEWSKDGRYIYYTSYAGDNPNLWRITVKTGKRELISNHKGLNTSATAHPSEEKIALRLSKDGTSEIYTMNVKTKKLKRMTTNFSIDTAPSYSPDGKEIAFVSNRSGNPHIYRLFTDNPSRVERLTSQGNYNQDPDYSPDGRYIAFTGRDEKYMFDVFLFDTETRSISRVTQNQGKNETPSFSPDGRLLVFSSDRTGREDLYISNKDGDIQLRIYRGKNRSIMPSWSPEIIMAE